MGLSFLGKGPVSLYALLLPFVCAYILYYRKETQMKGKADCTRCHKDAHRHRTQHLVVCLYLYLSSRDGFLRVSQRSLLPGVITTYVPGIVTWQFFLETGVWSLLTLTTLLVPFWKKRVESSKEYLFCLSWMLLILFFLSLLPGTE